MGVAAILVMWLGQFEQIFVPLSHGGSIWNLNGQAVSTEKTFKESRRRRTDNGACLYYKLTYEPKGSGELKINSSLQIRAFQTCQQDFSKRIRARGLKLGQLIGDDE